LTRSRSISWGEWAGLIKAKSFRSWQGPPV
jgi:hypothetical protein